MSKTIGNMTLKAVPVGTDMVAIADSEDLDKTKKVLLSAISGGGVANLTDLTVTGTYSGGILTFTASETFTPVDGDLYKFKAPVGNTTNATDFNLVIGGTTYPIYFVLTTPALSNAGVIQAGTVLILSYSSADSGFYVVFNSLADAKFQVVGGTLLRSSYTILPDVSNVRSLGSTSSRWSGMYATQAYLGSSGARAYQEVINNITTTPVIAVTNHQLTVFTNPLESLTITAIPTTTIECEYHFTTASTFTFSAPPLVGKWIGGTPTFGPNKSYTIVIKNGIAACGEVF